MGSAGYDQIEGVLGAPFWMSRILLLDAGVATVTERQEAVF